VEIPYFIKLKKNQIVFHKRQAACTTLTGEHVSVAHHLYYYGEHRGKTVSEGVFINTAEDCDQYSTNFFVYVYLSTNGIGLYLL